MKIRQQEVLLIIDTKFSSSLWHENQTTFDELSSEHNYLESACWQGVLSRSLPEILNDGSTTKSLKILQIKACNNFLELDFAESEFEKDIYFTIDPYLFRKSFKYN